MRLFWVLRDGNSKHSIWRLKRHFRAKPGCGGKPPWLAMISSKKLRDEWRFFSASTCPSFRPLEKISVISLNPRNWELTYLMTGKYVFCLALECLGCVFLLHETRSKVKSSQHFWGKLSRYQRSFFRERSWALSGVARVAGLVLKFSYWLYLMFCPLE